jgi:transposase, IS5 family
LLRSLTYRELARVPSVHELLRILERSPYKMNILGLEQLLDDSVFNRFKRELGRHMDRIVTILVGILKNDSSLYQQLGVDSTKLDAYTYKDKQAGWIWDHMDKRFYKGYKIHFLYYEEYSAPLVYTVTSACVYDNHI